MKFSKQKSNDKPHTSSEHCSKHLLLLNREGGGAKQKSIGLKRKIVNKLFTSMGYTSILLMAFFLLIVIVPVFTKGLSAYVFRGTVEYRELMHDQFGRGDTRAIEAELESVKAARQPILDAIKQFEAELDGMKASPEKRELRAEYKHTRKLISELLGPIPGDPTPILMRSRYGKTRWDQSKKAIGKILNKTTWDYSGDAPKKVLIPRASIFEGTSLTPVFEILSKNPEKLLNPKVTFYPRFLTDSSMDAHFFGGIGPEVMGTVYLTLGAMLLAVPLGIVAAIYFHEFASGGPVVGFLRSCVNTLSGVPSIVFGLFGLAFFINTLRVSPGKSVLAGSLTLALLVLPTIIRSSEEALAAVPQSYREGAMALGASRWKTIVTIIVPAALPGILTGIVISMGRAAGETAPIIFTAAVSVGKMLSLGDITSETPALSWNLYNIATEHEAVDEIRHVQYGMAATLVAIVLALNMTAILIRARVSKKLRG